MDRTVSRRSEPSSRTALMGEQPNPWNLLQPQVAKSRHRGAKPSRRCELLGKISLSLLPLHSRANLRLARGNLCTPPLPFGRPTPHRNCLPETVPRPVGPGTRYPFVEGRSSFSWEYGMGYFSAVAPGTRTLARGIFSTPSYPEKAGAPCVLEPITIFRLT
ncbi:hypothetical protein RIF29_48511 [Crotalaria pallida]|uniref:Cell wall-associated hydrolase n=1 Tax=Crotalaria pallida TaxID=3830 RepID=A0AAN9DQ29_CROPI